MTAFAVRLTRRFARFVDDRRGVSAVEFALLLPVMVSLYLGSVEVSTGIAVNRKVTLTASALANIASQYTNIAPTDMSNILNAAADIISPYSSSNLQVVVSQITISSKNIATVEWSQSLNGSARTVGSTVTLPTALNLANSYLILGEAQYNYNPTFGYVLTKTLTLKDQIYMRPRQSTCVEYNSVAC